MSSLRLRTAAQMPTSPQNRPKAIMNRAMKNLPLVSIAKAANPPRAL